MLIAIIGAVWTLSLLAAFRAGFYWSKRFSCSQTLREEVARRARLGRAYVQATVAVLVPAYKRRWDRQREEQFRAHRDSLVPFERADWWHERNTP